MPIKEDDIALFEGGELEVMNPGAGSLIRGEIRHLNIEGVVVHLLLRWQARAVGLPPSGWKFDGFRVPHIFDMRELTARKEGDEVLLLTLSSRRTVRLRKGVAQNRLAPSRVLGLDLTRPEAADPDTFGWPGTGNHPYRAG